ncbi:MAG: GNAT family N-acetyltransferase [Terriglobales bacterium]
MTSSVEVRRCQGIDELEAAFTMQKEVWGFSDADMIPKRMFVVAQKIGGQVLGAFDGGQLIGFALAIPGMRNGHSYMHSHMLAVKSSYRNSGVGRRLKLFQREDALSRGVELIEWTFDPLEIKNAFLNIEKLGAIARRYNINQYGSTSSPLHGGLPTDRLMAEWWLKSKRVTVLLEQGSLPRLDREQTVSVPAQVYEWKANPADRERAAAVQQRNRELLMKAFDEGLAALGYERDEQGNGTFLLGRWDEDWSYGCPPDAKQIGR